MTRKVILEDKDGEELVPYTELATNQQPGRVRPDGSSLVVNSNGVISVNGATGTEIGYLSGVTSGLQGQLNNTDHKTGNETIGGVKTITSGLIRKIEGLDVTTAPLSNQYIDWVSPKDKNEVSVGFFGTAYYTDEKLSSRLGVTRYVNGRPIYADIQVAIRKDGTISTSAPTPPAGDNSSQIATTAYVTNKVSTKADKASFQVVSALPANPDSNTFYFIPE